MAGRVRHPIDVRALEAYLQKNVPEIETPLEVKQFGFGQSNPTYQLTSPSGARHVLRKKPPGKLVSSTAHKVEREHRVLVALTGAAGRGVPVPRPLCLCTDAGVLGTPFYVMTFLDGRVIEDPTLPDSGVAARRAMWEDAARTLARLHRVDVAAAGLAGFGRPAGFYARQVETWRTICAAQGAARDAETGDPVGQLAHFADLVAFFGDEPRRPRDRTTLVHGDYKIDNLVYHRTEPRVIGILDWEMSTTGHPLSDLANLLAPYATAHMASSSSVHAAHAGFLPGATPGLPDPQDLVALYAAEAGWEPTRYELQWAQAFSAFRLAAICQGIAARVAARQASSAEARQYADARGPLAEFAWELARKAMEGEEARRREEAEGDIQGGKGKSRL